MAEYQIRLSTIVDTSKIQGQINKVKNPQVTVDARLNIGSIQRQINRDVRANPILIDVRLNTSNVQQQIANIRRQLLDLNNITINLGAANRGAGNRAASRSTGINSTVAEANKAYTDLMSLAKRINSIRLQIGGLDAAKNSGQIQELSTQLNRLMTDYNNLYSTFTKGLNTSQLDAFKNKIISVEAELAKLRATEQTMSKQGMDTTRVKADINTLEAELRELHATYMSFSNGLSMGQVDALGNVFQITTDKVAVLNQKLADMRANAAKGITANFGKYEVQLLSLENRFNVLATKPPEVSRAIESVRQSLNALRNADGTDDLIAKNDAYKESLKELETWIKRLELAEKGSNNDGRLESAKEAAMRRLNSLFSEGSAAAKKYGKDVALLREELNRCGNIQGVQNVTRKINALGTEIKNTGIRTKSLSENIKNQFQKYSTYFSVASVIMYGARALRSMFEQVKAVDSAMTELKKVTNESDASYNQFLSNAASRAKELGTTIDGLVSSTADFARLGYSFKESQGLAEVANIYAVVGDEIDGVEDATQSLVSTLAAFKSEMGSLDESDFAMSIVDKMNEVSNNFAISSGGLGEALQRSASSMAAANNSLDETIALITAANTVAQNPEKVGNAFKTMSMRIRGAKTELEEAGESTEGMAESTASLRAELLALSGVDIMLDENTFKSTYQIMDELSQKWSSLSDIAQATITELVAGKHQGNVMSSLMANFDIARDALNTSLNSSGSAMAEHAKWSESLEARLNKLKAAWQSLSQTFMNSDFLKVSISVLTKFIDILDKTIGNLGGFGTIGLGVAISSISNYIKGAKEAKKTINDVVDAIESLNDAFTNYAGATDAATEANMRNVASETAEAEANAASAASEMAEAEVNTASVATELAEAEANAASAVAEAAESEANAASATSEAAEAAANAASTATELAEAEANVISTTSELAEAKANATSAASELAEAEANAASAASEMAEAAANAASATSDAAEAAAGAAGGFAAFAGSTAGVVAGIGILVAVLGLAYNQYKKNKEAAAEARQEAIDSSNAYLSAASSFEQAYIKYSGKTILTESEESELASAINGTVNALGDKSSALQSAVNSSNNYLDSLEAIKRAELEATKAAAEKKRNSAADGLIESAIGWGKFDGSEVDITFGTTKLLNGAITKYGNAAEIADKVMPDFYKKTPTGKDGYYNAQIVLSSDADASEIVEYYNSLVNYKKELENAGLTESNDFTVYTQVNSAIEKISGSIGDYIDGTYNAVKANYQLSEGIPKTTEAYIAMREAILTDEQLNAFSVEQKMGVLNSLESEYGRVFDLSSVEAQARKFIGIINGYNDGAKDGINEIGTVETFLNMRTAVNNNECTVGQYLSEFNNITSMAEKFSDEERTYFNTAFGLDMDTIKKQYDDLLEYLPEKIGNKTKKDFLDGLSKNELSAAYNLRGEIDWVNGTPSEILAQIKEEARVNEAMSFTFSIEVQTEGLEALNTALSESRSATGLTADSLNALKSRYEDLDGFNAAALFENTALGVRLNNEELARLESQYEAVNKLDIDKKLSTLASKYKELTDKISACTDEKEKEKLQLKADNYADKIEELSSLASMYDGLTSSFSKWQDAMSSPNNGDNYDSIFDNFEKAGELYKTGLVGTDDFKTFAQLMTNEDLSGASVGAFVSAYKNGLPVMKKYFTEGQNGCKNFLKDISNINSEWAHLNEDGKWEINFDTEDVAKELGISADAVLLIVEKLRDFGFEVKIKDNSLKNIQTEIEKSEAKLKELGAEPYEVDLTIEANSQNLVIIESEINKIKTHISEINNSSVDPKVKEAQLEDARLKLEALIQKKQEASQPAFMKLDSSQVGASLVEALEKVQAYQTAINELNKLSELKEAGIVIDDSQIDSAKQKVDECAKAIQGLNEDVKVAIGLDENASIDQIKKAFEDGKINIDANTDPATTKIERLAKEVDKIEDKDVTINVTVKGLDEVKELNRNIDLATNIDGDIDSLTKYVDSAKALSELGSNITSYVTANITGNVIDTKERDLEKISVFADGARGLKGVGSFTSNVKASIDGNIIDISKNNIENLKAYSDNAKDVGSIGTVSSKVTANVEGDVIDTAEYKINNLKTYSESAKDVSSIGNVTSKVTANVEGSVLDTNEANIKKLGTFADNAKKVENVDITSKVTADVEGTVLDAKEKELTKLGTFADNAKKLDGISDITVKVTADVGGNAIDSKNKELEKLGTFADNAKKLDGISDTTVKVTADVEGTVLDADVSELTRLGTFADNAKKLDGVKDTTVKVTADVEGTVFDAKEKELTKLGTFADNAKKLDGISDVISKVTADVEGTVLDAKEKELTNIGTFADNAKKLDGISDTTVKVTADVEGSVIDSKNKELEKLGTFADNATKLDGIGDVISKVTADVEGTVLDAKESELEKLGTYGDNAKKVRNVGTFSSRVQADVLGTVLDTKEDQLTRLGTYGDNAIKVKDVGTFSSYVTANVNGNVISDDTVVLDLEHFASVVSGMQNQSIAVNVTANVDSANINQAIDLLTNLSTSGVFKDYSATVQVGATIATIDDTTVQSYEAPDKDGKVIYEVDSSDVDAWVAPDKTGTVNYSAKVEALTHDQLNKTGTITYVAKVTGKAGASGTAHAGGTASGRAFARGDWGIKGNGVALGGELGRELVVRDGKFFTVGDEGAEFFRYKKNDIVFNASQTESLFKYGGIKGANPRGKMLASGSAFVEGNAFGGSSVTGGGQFYGYISGGSSGSSGSSNSSSEKIEKSDDKDFYDWIEILINRIERAIDYFEKKANNVFDSWENRGDALNKQTDLIRQEIEKQQEAYDYYLQYANSLVISSDSKKDAEYKERIQNGTIKISQYTGDDREKLENYKQFYDKALDCKDAIEELKEAESELYKQRLDNVVTRYEGILGVIEHEKSMLEEYINQSEEQAWLVSREYYNALADNERENVAELEAQKAEMLNAFNEAMDSGTIAEGSEAYYEMVASIDEVTLAITESHTTLLEYEQTLQQLNWEVFDILQDKISSVTDETEFLIELLSSDKLFDDNGQLTDAGMATMGQHGVAYNAYMHQADLAAAEAARLKSELEKDPYDTELEERYREMISLQQEHILSAQGEKEAIRDLVEEGIGLELEALQELIDKKNEALESERDLYEYQKKVKEQTEEIASLEKQMAAYSGDDSEEAKQKIQKIKVDLESARQDLEEAEYDKFIDDSAAMLDELYLDYETILNTRLDNIDALLEDMIEEINASAIDISNTLSEKADSVGYTLSDSMAEIWDKNSVSTQNVITTYSEKFITAQTTTNNALDSINIKLQDMINKLNEKATANVKSASTSSVAKSTTTKSTTTTTTTKKSTSGGDGTPKIGDKVKFVDGQYYYDSYGMRPLGSQKQGQYVYITNINKKSGATHPYHISTGTKLGSGDLGWLKLSQISGYATGKKNFSNDEIAWTQEGATEFIVRPSDGAILTPIAKRDSVLTSAASRNIWDMANSPAEFIKNNLNFGSAGVPNSSNVQNNYTQHLEKVVISFPNVKNYDEVLSALRDDKSFEKLVHSMTIDRIAGKSSLAKGKSIR